MSTVIQTHWALLVPRGPYSLWARENMFSVCLQSPSFPRPPARAMACPSQPPPPLIPPCKTLFVLIDGLGDVTVPSLACPSHPHGRTPLEAARTPNLDFLASHGLTGLLDSVEAGQGCGSDTAHLSILGYDPLLAYRGRGALETMGSGLEMQEGDVAFKSNFACFAPTSDAATATAASATRSSPRTSPSGIVTRRRVDRNFHHWGLPLIAALDGLRLPSFPDVFVTVKHAVDFRCGVRLRGPGLSDRVAGSDPLVDQAALKSCVPLDDSPEAVRTAAVCNELSALFLERLSAHPLNLSRAAQSLPQANMVLLRGPGACFQARPPFATKERLSGKAIMVAPTAIIAGVGQTVGFEVVNVAGATGDYHTNLEAKARLCVSRLREAGPPASQTQFAFLHIKAVDDAGHDRDVARKIEWIERSDAMVGLILSLLAAPGPNGPQEALWSLVVTGDHSTPVRYGDHAVEPVPFVVTAVQHLPAFTTTSRQQQRAWGHNDRAQALRDLCTTSNPVRRFDEISCAQGLLGRFPGREVMPLLRNFRAQLMGREAEAAPASSQMHHAPPTAMTPSQGAVAQQLHSHPTAASAASSASSSGPSRSLPLLPSCREGLSPWLEDVASLLPLFSPPASTPFPERASVVIVGAGLTGLCCAWELARSGVRDLIVVDRGSIGSGATGRNGGHMTPSDLEEVEAISRLFKQLVEEGVNASMVDYVARGGMFLSKMGEAAPKLGPRSASADSGSMPRVPSSGYYASSVRPHAGSIHPMKLLLCIAAILRDKYGVFIWQSTAVRSIEHAPAPLQSQWLVHTTRGPVTTKVVVHATNAWVSELVPELKGLVVPVRNHVIQTTPILKGGAVAAAAARAQQQVNAAPDSAESSLSSSPAASSSTPSPTTAAVASPSAPLPPPSSLPWYGLSLGWHDGFDYLMQRPTGSVVVGGHRYWAPHMDTNQSDSAAPLMPHVLESLRGLLPRTFGSLLAEDANASVSVSHAWAGILGFTADFDPFLGGVPSAPGQFVAAGFSGHGMPRCHPAAHMIAAQVALYLADPAMFVPVELEEARRSKGVPTQPAEALLKTLGITTADLQRAQQTVPASKL